MARGSALVCLKSCQSAQACHWGYIKTAISKNEHIQHVCLPVHECWTCEYYLPSGFCWGDSIVTVHGVKCPHENFLTMNDHMTQQTTLYVQYVCCVLLAKLSAHSLTFYACKWTIILIAFCQPAAKWYLSWISGNFVRAINSCGKCFYSSSGVVLSFRSVDESSAFAARLQLYSFIVQEEASTKSQCHFIRW